MQIRDTDDSEDIKELKKQRSSKDRWIQAVFAMLVAGATALSGTTYVQLQEQQSDPAARPDPFTGTMGEALEARLLREMDDKIAAKSDYNIARWTELSENIKVQFQTVRTLADTVQSMLSRCAEIQVRDSQMLDMIRDNRDLLRSHLGLAVSGHKPDQK